MTFDLARLFTLEFTYKRNELSGYKNSMRLIVFFASISISTSNLAELIQVTFLFCNKSLT